MNKLHTLCALILLTACGGSPPVWNGEWETMDDGAEGKLTMKITDYDQYDASRKRVLFIYNGRIEGRCRFKNAEESDRGDGRRNRRGVDADNFRRSDNE